MKKFFYFMCCIFLLSFLSGCSVNYDLSFYGNELEEKLTISLSSDDSDGISDLKSNELVVYVSSADGIEYESDIEEGTLFKKNFYYTYTVDKFNNSPIFTQCYDQQNFVKNGDYYYLSTSDEFQCMYYDYYDVDNVTINFSTEYVVVNHNADEVRNGVYTWYVNNSNKGDKPIKLVIDVTKKNAKAAFWDFIVSNSLVIFVLGVIFIFFIIYLFFNRVSKLKNKL